MKTILSSKMKMTTQKTALVMGELFLYHCICLIQLNINQSPLPVVADKLKFNPHYSILRLINLILTATMALLNSLIDLSILLSFIEKAK